MASATTTRIYKIVVIASNNVGRTSNGVVGNLEEMDVAHVILVEPSFLVRRATLLAEVRARSAERSFRRVVTALSESQSVTVNAIRELVESHPGLMTIRDDREGHEGWNLLHHAASNQAPVDVAKYLARESPIGLHEKARHGLLPLHIAVEYGMPIESIMVFTRAWRGALRERSHDHDTPLCAALAHAAPVEVILFLAMEDPITLQIECDGFLPLHAAIHFEAPLSVVRCLTVMNPEALRARSNDWLLPFHMAIENSDFDTAKILLGEYPEALEARDDGQREHSLHYAARSGTVAAAEWLVDRNPALLNATNDYGWLPLHLAVRFNSVDVVQVLVRHHPAAARVTTPDLWLPLHHAARKGKLPSVRLLADEYPEALRMRTSDGFFPLHVAAVSHSVFADIEGLDVIYYLARTWPEAITGPAP